MAKIKNVGDQPRGFFTDQGEHVVVEPGDEAEFNMTEADFNKLKELNENEGEKPPLEIGGSFGGVKAKSGAGAQSEAQREREALAKQAAEEEKKAEERAKLAEKAEGKAEREHEREAPKKQQR